MPKNSCEDKKLRFLCFYRSTGHRHAGCPLKQEPWQEHQNESSQYRLLLFLFYSISIILFILFIIIITLLVAHTVHILRFLLLRYSFTVLRYQGFSSFFKIYVCFFFFCMLHLYSIHLPSPSPLPPLPPPTAPSPPFLYTSLTVHHTTSPSNFLQLPLILFPASSVFFSPFDKRLSCFSRGCWEPGSAHQSVAFIMVYGADY